MRPEFIQTSNNYKKNSKDKKIYFNWNKKHWMKPNKTMKKSWKI